jgi:hypothetical protein
MNATSLAARKLVDRSRLNATVEARVTPLGLAGVTRRLESMQISGTVMHGNYLSFAPMSPTGSWFPITRGADSKPVTLDSSHEHRTR